MENRKGAVTKIAKTLFSLFSNEVRFKGVNLAPKEKVGADLLIQTNKYHKKSNRTLILIMQPLELR